MNTCLFSASIEWTDQGRLVWLLLIPLAVWLTAVSAGGWRLWRIATTTCRCLVVLCLVVAWAGPIWRSVSQQPWVVFVDDRSASVDGGQSDETTAFVRDTVEGLDSHSASFLSFAGRSSGLRSQWSDGVEDLGTAASNPSEALLRATGLAPRGHVPRVVLLTDGLETQGELFSAANIAGLPVDVLPLPPFSAPEVAVTAVKAPALLTSDETFSVELIVRSNQDAEGTIEVFRRDYLPRAQGGITELEPTAPTSAGQRKVTVAPGVNRFRFAITEPVLRNTMFRAQLSGFPDTLAENNSRRTVAFADEPLRLLLIDSEPESAEHFAKLLRRRTYDAEIIGASGFGQVSTALSAYDLVMLSDVPSAMLGEQAIGNLHDYVRGGGGLVVVGGEATYAPTAFRGTKLESMLPLKAAELILPARRTIAMLLVIDKSTSMLDENRMKLAKEAAKLTVDLDLLTKDDKLGILAFGDQSEWVCPIVPCDDKSQLKQRIDQLTAEGRTNMYPALQRALLALTDTSADRRHVILLTDGVPAPSDFDKLARQMADAGITVSTVSVGEGADRTMLKDLARIAGGRHIDCAQARELPDKLVEEARSAAGGDRQSITLQEYRHLPDLSIDGAPPLAGYAPTSPKPSGELLLLAEGSDPLLAWWRYGAGTVVAFTSDVKQKWGEPWQNWEGHGDFWSRIGKHARRKRTRNYDLQIKRNGDRCSVSLELVDQAGQFLNGLEVGFSAELLGGETAVQDFAHVVPQVAPGRYALNFRMPYPGDYHAALSWEDADGDVIELDRFIPEGYPDEWVPAAANESLLRNVAAATGGVFAPSPSDVLTNDGRSAERVTPLWRTFVLLAILLFVVEVGLRRSAD